jgi:(4S)-4-hydroxy-5-phosphonooxypentane-2,3-dione isomerase
MFVVVVEFTLKPGFSSQFCERVKRQATDSLSLEPDCHVFDVCIDSENEHVVLLYEVYTDRSAFERHLFSNHFLDFDAGVADWISDKRVATYSRI